MSRAVSERSGGGGEKERESRRIMAAYVTFRMTLAGHRSAASSILLLPKGTSYLTRTHAHTHKIQPAPGNVAVPG